MMRSSFQVHGIASSSRIRVKDLSGIDTTGKLVIQSKDGSGYEILAPSQSEYQQMLREGGSGVIDPSKAPPRLRCSLSGAILVDAVLLPCCHKVQNPMQIVVLDAYLPLPCVPITAGGFYLRRI